MTVNQEKTEEIMVFLYRNHRGEFGIRRVRPIEIYFGSTPWHPQPQWLMRSMDLDKGEFRSFALADMLGTPRIEDAETTHKRLIAEAANLGMKLVAEDA